jgi:tetratricopeptide (TPR) repeat protein
MSSGYTLLEQGDPEAAIAAFERAANLGVNEEQARAAIAQTETEVANARINAARERIAAAEADEQWQDAVAAYDDVLAIAPTLIFAIEGRDYARKRANLNQLLTYAINNPERFSDDDVFQETVDVYFTGRAIENPGPRLQGQLDELQVLLETSQVPLDVTLVSDNRTEVTVLRVADLGLFEQTTLTLKPGNYVAVGSRLGYREVRKEFTVGFGKTPEQVVVQCEERVVATSR